MNEDRFCKPIAATTRVAATVLLTAAVSGALLAGSGCGSSTRGHHQQLHRDRHLAA